MAAESRGRCCARWLVRLASAGATQMTVCVLAANPTLRFYEQSGATRIRRATIEICGEMYDTVELAWDDLSFLLGS